MARFGEIAKGKRSRQTITLPLYGAKVNYDTGEWEGPTHKVDIRPLTGAELIDVSSRANERAKAKGGEAKEGDRVFDIAFMAETVAAACVDPESPENAPRSFFTSADEVLTSESLGEDHLLYLFECVEQWQERCSPRSARITSDELFKIAARVAFDETDLPFVQLRPGLRATLLRFTARQWWNSLINRSPSTSDSEASSPNSNGSPTSEQKGSE